MKITAITCTGDRPAAFALCEAYVSRQTHQPSQWIVLDDGSTPTVCTKDQQYIYCPECRGSNSLINKLKMIFASGLITGDAVAFIEDDDYYASEWLAECAQQLKDVLLFGEGKTIYYNVKQRWWFQHTNMAHASLCATAIRKELFSSMVAFCRDTNPFIDARIWKYCGGRSRLSDPSKTTRGSPMVIGMKAMPGRVGYSLGHTQRDPSARDDKNLTKLISLLGIDSSAYVHFWEHHIPVIETRVPAHTETGRSHGPQWSVWLKHLIGKPNIAGLEVGTFRGDSAEWMLENIFYHEKAKYTCVDPFTGSLEHTQAKITCDSLESDTRMRLKPFPQTRITVGLSQDILGRKMKKSLDFVYVDGDHRARSVLRDGVLAFDLLKVGGIMIFDDYEWADMMRPIDRPKIGIDSFLAAYADHLEILAPTGWQIAVKKLK